jgi:ArsR family transcriptional regulator, virulence genes transcriptional regulator
MKQVRTRKAVDKRIFQLHAAACKTLASAKRLEILNLLRDGELTVSEIVNAMKISKANVSQHLAIMRGAGILETRRAGLNVFYRIENPKVTRACELMREVLLENHSRTGKTLRNGK